jgi:hypothetical protein
MLVAACCAASHAHAQLFRAYLASDGSDSNPCTLALPCRLLPAALAAANDGGEIWMLDSANYNSSTVTIGKSVTILAVPGVVGSIVALNGGPAIDISANGLKVGLRNVVVVPVAGAPAGTNGVSLTGASTLTIEKSLIAGLPGSGVYVIGAGILRVNDTTLRGNGEDAIALVNGAKAMISATRMLDNYRGVRAWSSLGGALTTATVTDSVISGGNEGVQVYTNVAATARVSVARITIERTASTALVSYTNGSGNAEINFGSSLIANNPQPWYQNGAGSTVLSLGNNQLAGNGAASGNKTPLPMQ